MNVLVLHGPNLNLLGKREPGVYGKITLDEIDAMLNEEAVKRNMSLKTFQSNNEGDLVGAVQNAEGWANAIIINPAGYTTTSVALRDAVLAVDIPVVEVHISNIFAREKFRQESLIAPVAVGTICGFGMDSYRLALEAVERVVKA